MSGPCSSRGFLSGGCFCPKGLPHRSPPWTETPMYSKEWAVCILLECILITGRNEVLAKVIFLHLSVIHSVHRGGVPDQAPPRDQVHPPGAATSGIRSTIGRYASYWNAFLFVYQLTFGLTGTEKI